MKINLSLFSNILSILKSLHWVTRSYAKHMALDKAYGSLNDLFDSFVETALGIYGRDKALVTGIAFKLVEDADIKSYLETELITFNNEISKICGDFDDLRSIYDSIREEENKLMYLLGLD